MENSELLRDILLAAAAASEIGGAVAHSLRLPTIIGFLIAGAAISPSTPGPVGNIEDIGRAADIGVIFLMFGIGIDFSFRQMIAYRRLILVGGGIQIVLTLVLGYFVGLALGLTQEEALVVGFLAISTSTVVAVKVLEARRELKSVPGIATINISILQDLSAVLMVIAIPALGGAGLHAADLGLALVKGLALIAFTFALSTLVLPLIWRRIALARSRELSLLAAVTLAIGLAAGSGLLGLSIAFGAFLAGLAISENEHGYRTLSDVIPLRELFASVFFVSMGMLIDPHVAWHQAEMVGAIALVIVAGKGLISVFSIRVAGLSLAQAILTALLLAQVGEFSFVIARTALAEGVISGELASVFIVAAVLSIVLNPGLVATGPRLIAALGHLPGLREALSRPPGVQQPDELAGLRRHVVICGYGDAARALVRSLRGRNLPFVLIENNPFIFEAVRRHEPDLPFIYGDATRPEVLELAHVQDARVLAVTLANPNDVRVVTLNARALQPALDVVARGSLDSHPVLRQAGASEVVDPEFEASLEFVRHVLHRFGVDGREVVALQTRWRGEHYRVD